MRPRATSARPSRRSLLAGALGVTGAGLLSACGSSGGSSTSAAPSGAASGSSGSVTPVKFQLSWLTTTEFAGSYLAVEKGYYKANGLDVTLVPGGPNTAVEPLLVAGRAFVGGSNADATSAARAKGAKLKIFGARYQKNPFCVLSLADKPISSPQEMIGKKIGVAAANQVAFNALCKINGIDISKITVVPVQFDPTPVANKEVDGQVVYITDEPSILELKGIKTHTFLFADFKYDVYADCYVTTEENLSSKSDLLVAFLKSERQGWQYNLDHLQEGADLQVRLYGKKLGTDPKQAVAINEAQKQLILTDTTKQKGLFWIDAAEVDANVKTLAVAGITTTKDLFTTQILEKL